jgi:hypothetical protein
MFDGENLIPKLFDCTQDTIYKNCGLSGLFSSLPV